MRRLACVGLAVLAVAVVSARQTVIGRPFVLAVSGWSGGLEIVGRFDGTRWRNTWPEPAEIDQPVPSLRDVPVAWLGKRVPRSWTLWMPPDIPVPVTIAGTRRGLGNGGGCTQPVVLTLNVPAPLPARAFDGGIATDSDQPIERFETFTPGAYRWVQFEPFVRDVSLSYIRDRFASPRFERAPVRLEVLARPVQADLRPLFYYFVASKRLAEKNSTFGVVVSGWIKADPERPERAFALTAHAFEGDEDQGNGLRPLGVIRTAGRVFWLMRQEAYESAAFLLYELTDSSARRLLTTSSGGC